MRVSSRTSTSPIIRVRSTTDVVVFSAQIHGMALLMRHSGFPGGGLARMVALCTCVLVSSASLAQEKARPYDRDLLRLSELLGAIHYLRELCAANDGDRWRKEMEALIEAEGSSALRRVTLTKRFNKGYRSFQRTYRSCTNTALTAIDRFVGEGAEIATRLVKKES